MSLSGRSRPWQASLGLDAPEGGIDIWMNVQRLVDPGHLQHRGYPIRQPGEPELASCLFDVRRRQQNHPQSGAVDRFELRTVEHEVAPALCNQLLNQALGHAKVVAQLQ